VNSESSRNYVPSGCEGEMNRSQLCRSTAQSVVNQVPPSPLSHAEAPRGSLTVRSVDDRQHDLPEVEHARLRAHRQRQGVCHTFAHYTTHSLACPSSHCTSCIHLTATICPHKVTKREHFCTPHASINTNVANRSPQSPCRFA
jgi:hypothetical protein